MHDGKAGRPGGPECLIRRPESSARISERRPEFNGGGRSPGPDPAAKRAGRPKWLEMWRGNTRAIAPSHQHTVLGLAHIRDTHGEPDSDRRQRDGEREGRNVCQHAMTEVVRFIPVPFIARQVVRFLPGLLLQNLVARISLATRWVSQRARPEFEHAVLVI